MKIVDLILSKHYIYIYADTDITLISNYGQDKVTYKAGSYEIDCYELLAEYQPLLSIDPNGQGMRLADGVHSKAPVFNLQLSYDEGSEDEPNNVEWYATNLRLAKMPASSVSIGGGSGKATEVESTLVDITEEAQELLGTQVGSKSALQSLKAQMLLKWDLVYQSIPNGGFTVSDVYASYVPMSMIDYLLHEGCILEFIFDGDTVEVYCLSPWISPVVFGNYLSGQIACDRLFSGVVFGRLKSYGGSMPSGRQTGGFYNFYADDTFISSLTPDFQSASPAAFNPLSGLTLRFYGRKTI